MRLVARKFLVRGLVQGVGFRYFTQRAAARHQVLGYVRNLQDGGVEAFAQGSEAAVEAFKHDLTAGPRFSRVEDIEEFVMDLTAEFSTFRIER